MAASVVAGVLVLFLMVLGIMRRKGWLGGKDSVYKGINIMLMIKKIKRNLVTDTIDKFKNFLC